MRSSDHHPLKKCGTFLLLLGLLGSSLPVQADTVEDNIAANQAIPIESNEVQDWPPGPIVSAESAILMEAETGTILYAKNIHAREYPASTTKLLTTLIVSEQCALDEIVTFSYEAVFDTPRDSNHIAMDVGQSLNVEECLNAILIRSANEVSFAVAEHITGTTWQDFADIMNERAAELGCVDSHFVNPNGLPDEDHYTSAYDMAMIGRAFFANEMLSNITLTPRLHIEASERQPNEKLELNQMLLIPGAAYAYDGLVGCKTGYTSAARSCLVSCAERDGMKLICVVMKDEAPYQYEDTISLFNYGFSNFTKLTVAEADTRYNIDNDGLFYSDNDIFGDSRPLFSLDQEDFIILPVTASISDTTSEISYDTADSSTAAVIQYNYHGVPVGSASVNIAISDSDGYDFDSDPVSSGSPTSENTPDGKFHLVFVNIKVVLLCFGGILAVLLLIVLIRLIRRNFQFEPRKKHARRHKRRRSHSDFSMTRSRKHRR